LSAGLPGSTTYQQTIDQRHLQQPAVCTDQLAVEMTWGRIMPVLEQAWKDRLSQADRNRKVDILPPGWRW
jgi:hypothetical protein